MSPADEMAEWLTQSALRVQTCIAMSTLSRAGGHGFDSRAGCFEEGSFGFLSSGVNAEVHIRPYIKILFVRLLTEVMILIDGNS